MKEFSYKITDPLGIHARPAGMFVKEISDCACSVTLTKGEKSVDAKKIFSIMGLAVKCGEEITVTLDGEDEDKVLEKLKKFVTENL